MQHYESVFTKPEARGIFGQERTTLVDIKGGLLLTLVSFVNPNPVDTSQKVQQYYPVHGVNKTETGLQSCMHHAS